jgi:hypothetical protein
MHVASPEGRNAREDRRPIPTLRHSRLHIFKNATTFRMLGRTHVPKYVSILLEANRCAYRTSTAAILSPLTLLKEGISCTSGSYTPVLSIYHLWVLCKTYLDLSRLQPKHNPYILIHHIFFHTRPSKWVKMPPTTPLATQPQPPKPTP